ncbi:MAG: hypothetical protein ABIG61_09705 [Planctomycetota bacterium]
MVGEEDQAFGWGQLRESIIVETARRDDQAIVEKFVERCLHRLTSIKNRNSKFAGRL